MHRLKRWINEAVSSYKEQLKFSAIINQIDKIMEAIL